MPVTPVTIVALLPEHRPALRRLYLEARQLAFPWLAASGLQLLDFDAVIAQEQVAVALVQHIPVGFIAWWPPDNFIHSLFVSPAMMRRGIGRALLTFCLRQLTRPATLKCMQANTGALAFYLAQGWQLVTTGTSAEGDFFLLSY